jgi:hypothetical protein
VGGNGANAGGAQSSGGTTTTDSTVAGGVAGTVGASGGSSAAGTGNVTVVGGQAGSATTASTTQTTGGSSQTMPLGGAAGSDASGGFAGSAPVGQPCQAYFQAPGANAVLTEVNDVSGQFCKNGLNYNVSVVTNAPAGTPAKLYVNEVEVATSTPVTVLNLSAAFPSALLGATGAKDLKVQIGTGDTACVATESVTVDCSAVVCSIQSPTINADTHPALNGVHTSVVGAEGDRVTSASDPYKVQFVVNTNLANGRPVTLDITRGATTLTPAIAYVQDGKATFSHVQLSTDAGVDGTYNVLATCLAANGDVGVSSTNNLGDAYPVDITPPDLVITRGSGANGATMIPLADGSHFAPADDVDPSTTDVLEMRICGTTTAPDAIDIVSTRDTTKNNFAVGLTSTDVVRAPVTAAGDNTACITMNCPGNAPFNLNVTLKDHAGNPQTKVLQGVTCAAKAPVVFFADPVEGDDFAPVEPDTDFDTATGEFKTPGKNKIAKRILAYSNVNATRKDQNQTRNGAQYTVKVCTSAQPHVGGAKLYLNGSSTAAATADVVTDTSGICTGDEFKQPNIAVFNNVDLPESTVDPTTLLMVTPTTIKVTVTDTTSEATSRSVDIWVDPTPAAIALDGPAGLCPNHYEQRDTPWTPPLGTSTEVRFTTSAWTQLYASVKELATATIVTYASANDGRYAPRYRYVPNITFPLGANTLSAFATKPSGNFAVFPASGSCNVSVGSSPPPQVQLSAISPNASPVNGSHLSANGVANVYTNAIPDSDPQTEGWQGTLRACTNLHNNNAVGVGLKFFANGTQIGADSVPLVADGSSEDGCASLSVVAPLAIVEGQGIQLTVQTTETLAGVGNSDPASVTVDVHAPEAPTEFDSNPDFERRQTTFGLSWKSPVDSSLSTYEVSYVVRRSSDATIDWVTEFASSKATDVVSSQVSTDPGASTALPVAGLSIETPYSFGMYAYDRGGNKTPVVHIGPKSAHFRSTEILPPTPGLKQSFGWSIDATDDVNGDAISDMVIGTVAGTDVYLYWGANGSVSQSPAVQLKGGTINSFGQIVSIVGDVNGDGFNDIAVGAPFYGNGAVYVFCGRAKADWPSVLTAAEADFAITSNASSTAPGDPLYASGQLGGAIARLGDFNGDTHDDFAIGVSRYNTNQGQVIVVYGVAKGEESNIEVPTDKGTKVSLVNGDVSAAGRFGLGLTGLNRFYGTGSLPAFVAAAPRVSSYLGRLYVIGGQSGKPATIALASQPTPYDGDITTGQPGSFGLLALGNVGPSMQPTFGIAYATAAGPSRVRLYSGTAATGPFAQIQTIGTTATSSDYSFGRFLAGGGVSGTNLTTSLIGSTRSDVVLSSRTAGNYKLYIVDGEQIAMSGTTNIEALPRIEVAMPSPLTVGNTTQDFARAVTIARDIDDDKYGDIAIGDVNYTTNLDGRVVVLH